ncbi:MAG: hypothetical protein AAGC74_07295 [Verrucomicrobiota bacterium]
MILVALGILTLPTLALDIPRHVFSLDKLEEAKTKAAEDQEPLVFVYTDPGTT